MPQKDGESDVVMEKRAFEVYLKSNNGNSFQLMCCFNIMRKFDKWSPGKYLPKAEVSIKNNAQIHQLRKEY